MIPSLSSTTTNLWSSRSFIYGPNETIVSSNFSQILFDTNVTITEKEPPNVPDYSSDTYHMFGYDYMYGTIHQNIPHYEEPQSERIRMSELLSPLVDTTVEHSNIASTSNQDLHELEERRSISPQTLKKRHTRTIRSNSSSDSDSTSSIKSLKKHLCDECNRSFEKKSHLEQHKNRKHLAKKLYKCAKCSKCFYTGDERKRHDDIDHLDVRPHKCPICFKAFRRSDQRNTHQRNVHSAKKANQIFK